MLRSFLLKVGRSFYWALTAAGVALSLVTPTSYTAEGATSPLKQLMTFNNDAAANAVPVQQDTSVDPRVDPTPEDARLVQIPHQTIITPEFKDGQRLGPGVIEKAWGDHEVLVFLRSQKHPPRSPALRLPASTDTAAMRDLARQTTARQKLRHTTQRDLQSVLKIVQRGERRGDYAFKADPKYKSWYMDFHRRRMHIKAPAAKGE